MCIWIGFKTVVLDWMDFFVCHTLVIVCCVHSAVLLQHPALVFLQFFLLIRYWLEFYVSWGFMMLQWDLMGHIHCVIVVHLMVANLLRISHVLFSELTPINQ